MIFSTVSVLFLWFIGVFLAAREGLFVSPQGSPPAWVGIGFAGPLIVFVTAFLVSSGIRARAVRIPPVLMASLHGWRFVGMGFIMAYEKGLLPPGFAWPAGLGDIAVALVSPYIAAQLAVRPNFIGSRQMVIWNLFGIVDFLTAVGLGVLHQTSPQIFQASIGTGLMQELPFVLIPCFFVPLLGMTNVIMLHQGRLARSR